MAKTWLYGVLAFAPILAFQVICGWGGVEEGAELPPWVDLVVLGAMGSWLLATVIFALHVWKQSTLETLGKVGFTLAFVSFLPATLAFPIYWFLQIYQPARTRSMLDID